MPIEAEQKPLRRGFILATAVNILLVSFIAFPVTNILYRSVYLGIFDIISITYNITAIVFWAFFIKISMKRYKRILWAFDTYYYGEDKLKLWNWRLPIENAGK